MSNTVNIYTLHVGNSVEGTKTTVFPSKEAFFEWAAEAPESGVLSALHAITPDGFKGDPDLWYFFGSESRGQWCWDFGDNTIVLVAHRLVVGDLESSTHAGERVFMVEEEQGVFTVLPPR